MISKRDFDNVTCDWDYNIYVLQGLLETFEMFELLTSSFLYRVLSSFVYVRVSGKIYQNEKTVLLQCFVVFGRLALFVPNASTGVCLPVVLLCKV